MIVAESVAQEEEDHEHDEHERQQQRELHVVDRLADRLPSGRRGRASSTDGRQLRLEGRQQLALTAVDHLDRVRAGLALDRER